jgi:hypothetical protein
MEPKVSYINLTWALRCFILQSIDEKMNLCVEFDFYSHENIV